MAESNKLDLLDQLGQELAEALAELPDIGVELPPPIHPVSARRARWILRTLIRRRASPAVVAGFAPLLDALLATDRTQLETDTAMVERLRQTRQPPGCFRRLATRAHAGASTPKNLGRPRPSHC